MRLSEKYEDFVLYLKQKGYAEKSLAEYRRFLFGAMSHSVQDIELEDLKMTDVASVIYAGRTHGEWGSQRAVCTFRGYLKYLKDAGHKIPIDYRDVILPKPPRRPVEYLTMEELNLIRNSLDLNTEPGLRMRTLIEVLIDTGMRISEVISLNKSDISYERKEAQVKNAKTKEWERVYFTDRSLEWIDRYLARRKDNLPFLFVSGRGRLLSVTSRNYLRAHCQSLGIQKHIKHHIFRKTFTTHLLHEGADIKTVQYLCRHKSERTTLKYYAGVCKENAKLKHQEIMSKLA